MLSLKANFFPYADFAGGAALGPIETNFSIKKHATQPQPRQFVYEILFATEQINVGITRKIYAQAILSGINFWTNYITIYTMKNFMENAWSCGHAGHQSEITARIG